MSKWIGFDDRTIAAFEQRKAKQVEIGIGDPLEVALQSLVPAMVIFPDAEGGARVITIRRHAPAQRRIEQQGTGFLGLQDVNE